MYIRPMSGSRRASVSETCVSPPRGHAGWVRVSWINVGCADAGWLPSTTPTMVAATAAQYRSRCARLCRADRDDAVDNDMERVTGIEPA